MIPQIEPFYGEEEIIAVTKLIESGSWLTEFKHTKDFEEKISEFLNIEHCRIVNSGTTAIAIACMALKKSYAQPFVAIPDFTMIGTAHAASLAGLNAKFVDSDEYDLCMDIDKLAEINRHSIQGVIYVSINGRCGNMAKLRDLCAEKEWWLIEDACQSFGSIYGGKAIGTYGDIGCFSLSPQKTISTGQGGICVTSDYVLDKKIKDFKDQGRWTPGTDVYTAMGYNFKYTDLQAAIGITQLGQIKKRIRIKKSIYDLYYSLLKNVKCVKMMDRLFEHTPWNVDIFTYKKQELIDCLEGKNIGSRSFYPLVSSQYGYTDCYTTKNSVAKQISVHGLWLPSSITLTEEEIKYICSCIKEYGEEQNESDISKPTIW